MTLKTISKVWIHPFLASHDLQTSAILETSNVYLLSSNDYMFGTGRPLNFMLYSRWLLSATREPHRLPACLPWFLTHDSEIRSRRPSVSVQSLGNPFDYWLLVVVDVNVRFELGGPAEANMYVFMYVCIKARCLFINTILWA